ncbi:MAG: acetylornithine deacetylase/succinyl-diaminopimelate desuccinylase family protein [Rhodobacteraceae bacterium]|nr:acetylornithine deacetylase/succinyl-diaminopimelate desuccinylase family protein [Paracoccaceae bacterium]
MDTAQKIAIEIEGRRDELVSLTQQLIRIPTINPPGEHYLDICELLRERLYDSGFSCELIRANDAVEDSDLYPRFNLVARYEGSRRGDCIHLNSHTDVVQVGRGWSVDPFAAVVRDGRIYGRGACDMKGGLATSIIAAEAFIACRPHFCGAIEISATTDEESGGFSGVAWLAEHGHFSPQRIQHAIIPEPLGKNRICLGHRGVWWAEIETKGRIAHGSMPFLGDCAIRHMSAVLAAIESELFPLLASKRTEMPVVPKQARQSSLNINSIHAGPGETTDGKMGFSTPCVVDRCRMVLDRRYLVEESREEVRNEIISMLDRIKQERPDFDYNIREIFSVQPTLTQRDAPIVTSVAEAIQKVLNIDPEYIVSPGTYDQKHIDRIGHMKNCIAYGPGRLELAHQPDEWVDIEDMMDSAKVMAFTLTQLLPDAAP